MVAGMDLLLGRTPNLRRTNTDGKLKPVSCGLHQGHPFFGDGPSRMCQRRREKTGDLSNWRLSILLSMEGKVYLLAHSFVLAPVPASFLSQTYRGTIALF